MPFQESNRVSPPKQVRCLLLTVALTLAILGLVYLHAHETQRTQLREALLLAVAEVAAFAPHQAEQTGTPQAIASSDLAAA